MRHWAIILVGVWACNTLADDWPQWLGPTRNGVSPTAVKPWTNEPKIVWKKAVGPGHSSPVVAKGIVYLHAKANGADAEELVGYAAADGKELFRTRYTRGPFQNKFGVGPRATPVVANDRVFTFGVTGLLTAFAADTGKQLWQVDTLDQFKAKNLYFGASAAPLVVEDKVIVQVGGAEASIVAFTAATGAVAWKAGSDPASYAAPVVVPIAGQPTIVVLTGRNVVGLAPADGTVRWEFPFRDLLNESSTTPILVDTRLIASSVTVGSVALTFAADAPKLTPKLDWKAPQLCCYFSTPVPVETHLYMVTGALALPPNKPKVNLQCVETATGKVVWTHGPIGTYHAALTRTANGQLLLLDDKGTLTLVAPDAAGFKSLATAKVCGNTWAHPALADNLFIVRDEKELIAVKLNE